MTQSFCGLARHVRRGRLLECVNAVGSQTSLLLQSYMNMHTRMFLNMFIVEHHFRMSHESPVELDKQAIKPLFEIVRFFSGKSGM